MSTFRDLAEVLAEHGLFCSLCTDRGRHYFFTGMAGGEVDRSHPTQVGRALAQLGIEHMAAYSPQARGRYVRSARCRIDCRTACAGGDLSRQHLYRLVQNVPAIARGIRTNELVELSVSGL